MVVDTSLAAILGCLATPRMREVDVSMAVNVGNGHTMAAIISKGRIIGGVDGAPHSIIATPEVGKDFG